MKRIECRGCGEQHDLAEVLRDVRWATEWTMRHARHGDVVISIVVPAGADASAIADAIPTPFGAPVRVELLSEPADAIVEYDEQLATARPFRLQRDGESWTLEARSGATDGVAFEDLPVDVQDAIVDAAASDWGQALLEGEGDEPRGFLGAIEPPCL